jgi:hypothetical protein
MRVVTVNGAPAVRIGTSVKYAMFVHQGTGVYGPAGRMIHPVNKKVLRWRSRTASGKKGKGYTFSMYSRGMKPNPFLKNALKAARG